jgi:DNA repair exonuclease SbcCD nuclease subunit
MYYVGSLIQLDWRETGDEKRFLIVNTDTLEVEEVPTSGYKKYIEFSIKEDNKQQTIEEAKKVLDEGNYVRIIKEEKVDTKGLDDFIIIDKVEKDITNRGITSTMSQEDRLKRYLEIKEVQESDQLIYFETAKLIIESCKPV